MSSSHWLKNALVNNLPSSQAQKPARPIPKTLTVLYLTAFAIGGGWLGYGVFDRWHWEDVQQNWVSTDGLVEAAYVSPAMGTHERWETGWTYSYSVNGRHYETRSTALNNAYFVHMFTSKARAEDDEVTRPVGSYVPVYYDPVMPQHSVLDFPEDSLLDILPLGLGATCIGVAIWGGFVLFNKRKSRNAVE